MSKPFVLWFTGLPKSGKTEVAMIVVQRLNEIHHPVDLIDSGRIRKTPLGSTLGFGRDDRETNVRRHAIAANLLTQNGVTAVVSAVSPYRDVRDAIRDELRGFVEVYVSTPKEACIERDITGTWSRAISGELQGFTGHDDPYEAPLSPEIEVDLSQMDANKAADEIVGLLQKLGRITQQSKPASTDDQIIAKKLSLLGYTEEE